MGRVGRLEVAEAIRERIVSGLHAGRYTGGERLPGTRALAADFAVNERVVLAALHALAAEGLLLLKPRSGTYVAPPYLADGRSLPDLGAWLVEVLVQSRARGLPPRQLPEYTQRLLGARRVRAACIECNDDQIHLLCSELANDHGYVVDGVELGELRSTVASAALERADVLVTTMFHITQVRSFAKRQRKSWMAVSLNGRVLDEVVRWLRRGPVYYIATDPRFEPKLRRMLPRSAPQSNLRVLLIDRDDLNAIPADAPTFVMTSAREHLARNHGARDGPGSPIHPARHLSDESARDLIAFIVRKNMMAATAVAP